jgi:hypothetical protein
VKAISGGINYNFSDAEERENNYLWTDYHRKLARDGNVYVVSDGQIIQLPTTTVVHVDNARIVSIPRILKQDQYQFKFQRSLC